MKRGSVAGAGSRIESTVLLLLGVFTVLKPKNPVSDPSLAGADGNPK